MPSTQLLGASLNMVAGAVAPTALPTPEGVAPENQLFASTLAELLADFLGTGTEADGGSAQFASEGGLNPQDLAALAAALQSEGQSLSAENGESLPAMLRALGIGIGEKGGETPLPGLPEEALALLNLQTELDAATDSALPTATPLLAAQVIATAEPSAPVLHGRGLAQFAQQLRTGSLPTAQTLSKLGESTSDQADSLTSNLLPSLQRAPLTDYVPLSTSIPRFDIDFTGAKLIPTTSGEVVPLASVGSMTTAALATNSTTLPPIPAIQTPLHQPGFNQELGERVLWMTKNQMPMADIRINPPHLGPIEVRVTVVNDQISVVMSAQHSTTRDALEIALPRLREMFADSGLTLSDANVANQSSQQQRQAASDQGANRNNGSLNDGNNSAMGGDNPSELESTTRLGSGQGVLDVFA